MQNQQREEMSISQLSDTELLSNTRALIGRSNQVFAALLAHLGEVEARGLHRTRACSSLYAYCIYELRLSEDAAVRRVTAARFVRQFPALLKAIAAGELHLTGLLMLGPHLTRDNHLEVLANAKHRTKKEIAQLVRVLDPLPEVPAKIEALGPARPAAARANWENHVASFCPVRELPPGDRPRDWIDNALDGSAPARITDRPPNLAPGDDRARDRLGDESSGWSESSGVSAAARIRGPLRYKVQFTATEEYVELVERARALLSKRRGPASIDEIQLEALRVFVTSLEKKRYGAGARRQSKLETSPEPTLEPPAFESEPEPTPEPTPAFELELEPTLDSDSDSEPTPGSPAHPRLRSRHVPAHVRRAVFDRDGARCTYVAATGHRCEQTHYLELHHSEPFAQGGEHGKANLALRCAAHNALAAELDFGPLQIAAKRDALRHLSSSAVAHCACPDLAPLRLRSQ
jgi:hypothetical protein